MTRAKIPPINLPKLLVKKLQNIPVGAYAAIAINTEQVLNKVTFL